MGSTMRCGLLVAGLAALGCSGKPDPAPVPDKPACEATIGAAVQRITGNDPSFAAAMPDRTRLTMIASCESERWSAEALACIGTTRLEVDLAACTEKLTHEQYERLNRKLAVLRSPVAVGVDAGVASQPPPPLDASAPADASVPVDARPRPPGDAGRAPSDAPAGQKYDCTKRIITPRDRACVQQYCAGHPDDAVCTID